MAGRFFRLTLRVRKTGAFLILFFLGVATLGSAHAGTNLWTSHGPEGGKCNGKQACNGAGKCARANGRHAKPARSARVASVDLGFAQRHPAGRRSRGCHEGTIMSMSTWVSPWIMK
jgi:hypothetical protein